MKKLVLLTISLITVFTSSAQLIDKTYKYTKTDIESAWIKEIIYVAVSVQEHTICFKSKNNINGVFECSQISVKESTIEGGIETYFMMNGDYYIFAHYGESGVAFVMNLRTQDSLIMSYKNDAGTDVAVNYPSPN
ncbi:MAG: hypothetical protein LBT04_07255 [Prevotellaceae bacterium]|jgi:hypothetical protein|nr:hypothetical protein [Prevotellaceae bacterium]